MAKLWEPFARLGTAALEVLEAEVEALASGLGVIRILESHLPAWAAAVLPGVALLLLAAGVTVWVRRGLASLEPPLSTVKRRLEDHTLWWRDELAAAQEPELRGESDDD